MLAAWANSSQPAYQDESGKREQPVWMTRLLLRSFSLHPHCQIPRAAFGWPRVRMPAGASNAGVTERCLHQINRRAVIKGVRGWGLTQPMGRDIHNQPGPSSSSFDDAMHGGRGAATRTLGHPVRGHAIIRSLGQFW